MPRRKRKEKNVRCKHILCRTYVLRCVVVRRMQGVSLFSLFSLSRKKRMEQKTAATDGAFQTRVSLSFSLSFCSVPFSVGPFFLSFLLLLPMQVSLVLSSHSRSVVERCSNNNDNNGNSSIIISSNESNGGEEGSLDKRQKRRRGE